MKKLYTFLLYVISIVLVDRIVKEIVLKHLTEVIVLIPNVLSLRLVYNTGVAFGMFDSFPVIIQAITGIIILSSLYALPRIPKRYVTPMAVVIGGAVGNFVDRMVYTQGVVDFISLRYFSIFNIADVAISAGIIWIIVIMYLDDKKK